MASTFTAASSLGSLVAPSAHKLSSANFISSSSFGRRQSVCLRRSRPAIVCAAKELHFNKDGTTIRKLQVRICIPEISFSAALIRIRFFSGFWFLISDLLCCVIRVVLTSSPTLLVSHLDQKGETLFLRASMDPQKLLMMV